MKDEQASKTAEIVAAFRAIHTKYHHDPKILRDPYAVYLTSDRLRRLVSNRFLHWLATRRWLYGWTYPLQGESLARARYAEDHLEAALPNGIRQYVILAAGFDSFSLRRRELLGKLSVFEVDHPATQRVKLQRLKKHGFEIPRSVTCVPVDMETEPLSRKLLASGYSRDICSFFSLLGTIPYLTREAFKKTLEELTAISPTGSLLVFDFMDTGYFTAVQSSATLKKQYQATKRRGEPLITAIDIPDLNKLLKDAGWTLVETLSPQDQHTRYFAGRRDPLRPLDHFHLARAKRL